MFLGWFPDRFDLQVVKHFSAKYAGFKTPGSVLKPDTLQGASTPLRYGMLRDRETGLSRLTHRLQRSHPLRYGMFREACTPE